MGGAFFRRQTARSRLSLVFWPPSISDVILPFWSVLFPHCGEPGVGFQGNRQQTPEGGSFQKIVTKKINSVEISSVHNG